MGNEQTESPKYGYKPEQTDCIVGIEQTDQTEIWVFGQTERSEIWVITRPTTSEYGNWRYRTDQSFGIG